MKKLSFVILLVLVLFVSCGKGEDARTAVVLGDLSFKIGDIAWTALEQNDDYYSGEVEGEFLMSALHTNEPTYFTTKQFAETISNSQRERGYLLDESAVVEINGAEYEKRVFSDAEATGYVVTYFISVDYDYYSLTFSYTVESESAYAGYIADVLSSLAFNYEPDTEGAEEAKRALMGEWDCGEQGYMVFGEDGSLYWYKDSSKDPGNVFIAEYSCDNKIKTVSNGFKKGIYLEVYFETIIRDGESQEPDGINKKEFGLVQDQSRKELYYAENITESVSFEMIKQK